MAVAERLSLDVPPKQIIPSMNIRLSNSKKAAWPDAHWSIDADPDPVLGITGNSWTTMRAAQHNLIYDVGAHKGEDTEFYLKKGFSVVAIEANPALYLALAKKFEEFINNGRLVLLNLAISDHSDEVTLFVSDKSDWGTTDPEWAKRNQGLGFPSRPISVKSERFETILQRHGIPYFLKVDIEGADLLCLHALKGFDLKPKFVSIESDKVSWKKLNAELSVLQSLGYSRFKAVNQGYVPHQQQPNPPREGVFVSHGFEEGSSGLFGEEAPGLWMSRAIVTVKYCLIFARYRLFGDNTFGSRILLKLSKQFPPCLRLRPSWYDTHAKLQHDPEKWIPVFPRDKRGTRLRGDHAQSKI